MPKGKTIVHLTSDANDLNKSVRSQVGLAGDTQLAAETNRTIPAFTEDYAFNEAVFQFFFPDSTLVNQIYYEFGTFVAGSNTANSGQIFNHALFTVPYSKSAGSDTTIEVDINIS